MSRNNAILDVVDLDTPPFERETNGMWIDVPGPTLDLLRRKGMNPAEAIHAAEHVVLNLAPLFALASAGDVRTECKVAEKEYSSKPTTRKRPARWDLHCVAPRTYSQGPNQSCPDSFSMTVLESAAVSLRKHLIIVSRTLHPL